MSSIGRGILGIPPPPALERGAHAARVDGEKARISGRWPNVGHFASTTQCDTPEMHSRNASRWIFLIAEFAGSYPIC